MKSIVKSMTTFVSLLHLLFIIALLRVGTACRCAGTLDQCSCSTEFAR